MAGKRIWIAEEGPYSALPTIKWTTAAASTIEAGMLLKQTTAGDEPVTPLVTGDVTIETDTSIVGLAAKESTDTATAAGYVEVYMPLPGVIYEGYATTAAGVDTQAKIDALVGDRVTLTISATTTAGDWTVDVTDSTANAFFIVGGDPDKKTLKFILRGDADFMNNSIIS